MSGIHFRFRTLLIVTAATIPLSVLAGRPLTVDDAIPVEPGDFEFEAGVLFERENGIRHYEVPFGLTYGLVSTVEVGVGFGGQLEQREELQNHWETVSGVGDLTVGFKWNPLSETNFWASQALAFSVKFPTANHHDDFGSGKADYDLTYIASKSLTDQVSVHLNAGYTWTGDPANENSDDVFHCGGAAGWLAMEKVEFVAELYSDIPVGHEFDATLVLNGGARWTMLEQLVLDAAVGGGLHGDAPDWMVTIGFTWAFNFK